MPLVDKQKVLDLIETKRKALDTEFDTATTTNERKLEINEGLSQLYGMRRDVNNLPDAAVPKVEDGT